MKQLILRWNAKSYSLVMNGSKARQVDMYNKLKLRENAIFRPQDENILARPPY